MNDDSLPPASPEAGAQTDEDASFEAFFRSGEEGTYRGGPGDSVAPVYADLDFDEPDDTFYERVAEREERRGRYRGYVSRLVGVLALGIVALVAVRVKEGAPTAERHLAAAIPVAAAVPPPALPPVPVPAPAPVPEKVEIIALEEEEVVAGEEPEPAPSPPSGAIVTAPRAPKALPKPSPAVSAPLSPFSRRTVLPGSGL